MSDNLRYHQHLDGIARADVDYVRKKDEQYDASWKRRGGQGAWFTVVRPWDRLENILASRYGNDIFSAIKSEGLDGADGSVVACVRDLRRYLLLVEAEMTESLTKPTVAELDEILREPATTVYARSDGSVSAEKLVPRYPHQTGEQKTSLPLLTIDSFEEFMRVSGAKQQLYVECGRHKWRLDETPPREVVEKQLPGARAAYVKLPGGSYVLDRRAYPDSDDYFPRLRHEVNGHEFEGVQPPFDQMYDQPSGADEKRVLRAEFRECWSNV